MEGENAKSPEGAIHTIEGMDGEDPAVSDQDLSSGDAHQIIERELSSLAVNPLNDSIYGMDMVEDLCESIDLFGIKEPLVITGEGRIISGHRRYRAAQKLGLKQLPVRLVNPENDDEEKILLIEHNRQRQKTKSQIAREASMMVEIKKAAKKAKKQTGKMENFPKIPTKPTRDEVGEAFGISGKTVEAGAKAIEIADQFRSQGDEEAALTVERAVDKSFSSGLAVAKKLQDAKKEVLPSNEPPTAVGDIAITTGEAMLSFSATVSEESEMLEKARSVAAYLEDAIEAAPNSLGWEEWRQVIDRLHEILGKFDSMPSREEVGA